MPPLTPRDIYGTGLAGIARRGVMKGIQASVGAKKIVKGTHTKFSNVRGDVGNFGKHHK